MGGAGLAKGFGLGGAGAAGATGQGVTGAALGGAGQSGLGLSAGAGEGLRLAGAGAGAPGLQETASNIGTQMAAKGAPMAFSGAAAPMTTAEMLKSGAMAAAPAMDAMMSQQPSAMPEETGSIPEYDYTAQMTGDYYQPGQGTHERRYFTGPTYTRRAAEGGSIGYANGGQLNLQGSFQMDDSQGGQGFNGYSPAGSGFSSDQMNLSHVMPTGGFSPRAIAADPSGFGQMLQNGLQREQQMPGSTMFSQLFAEGGIMQLAKGGMRDGGFVVPADVVSMVGEGNTEAGYKDIAQAIPGATPIRGKDGGQADTVKTSIEGKQPARVAHGEMYIPPEAVKKAGGAKKLYAMMDKVRKQAKGDTEQIKPVDVRKALA
jgi:hypothetical protein